MTKTQIIQEILENTLAAAASNNEARLHLYQAKKTEPVITWVGKMNSVTTGQARIANTVLKFTDRLDENLNGVDVPEPTPKRSTKSKKR